MPRPGPRPYECVRRAWHSDRHQPIRGSLIQEIFRVVNEIHSPATKKNREWQEKHPIVVLKAEEIMYSKANSEDEYMDLKTLWDRANDAINTIIRRQEGTETAGLLKPCIEAALNLGCIPRRATRSQRSNNARCYLGPSAQEPTNNPSSSKENTTHGNHTTNSQYMAYVLNVVKPTTRNSVHSTSGPHCPIALNKSFVTKKFPFSSLNFLPSSNNQCSPMETCPPSNLYSVHPLYYGNPLQTDESPPQFGMPHKPNSNFMEHVEMCITQKLSPFNVDGSNKTSLVDFNDIPVTHPEIECDLSLKLGSLSVPCASAKNSWHQEVEDVGSTSSREGSKFSDRSPQRDKPPSFCSRGSADDRLDSCLSKHNCKGESSNVEARKRKRKAIVCHPTENRQFCWQLKPQCPLIEE